MQPVKKTRSELLGTGHLSLSLWNMSALTACLSTAQTAIRVAGDSRSQHSQVCFAGAADERWIRAWYRNNQFQVQFCRGAILSVPGLSCGDQQGAEACGIWAMQGVEDTSEPVWTSLTVSECQGSEYKNLQSFFSEAAPEEATGPLSSWTFHHLSLEYPFDSCHWGHEVNEVPGRLVRINGQWGQLPLARR